MAFGTMIQRHFQPELSGDPHSRKDVVHPMDMGLQRDFPPHHRKPAFHGEILLKILAVLESLPFLLLIGKCLRQLLPEHGRNGHSGGGTFSLTGIVHLGILSEGHFHGRRGLHHQIVHPPALCLQKHKLPSHHIGAARTDHSGGDPRPHRIIEGRIHGIDGVYGPKLRGHGVHRLVAVIPLHAFFLLADPHMAMGLNDSRHNDALPDLYDPLAGNGMKIHFIPFSYLRYFSVLDADASVQNVTAGHGLDCSANYIHVFTPISPVFPPAS